MTADELIDSYVADVAKLLPRKQRRDVAMELRALLHDELDAKAGSSNREDAAMALLTGFGRPAEVATRYGSPVTLIDPADTRLFLMLSVAGAALIVLGGVLGVLTVDVEPGRELAVVLPQSWNQLFWWEGFLAVMFAAAAWVRRRWPHTAIWKPRPVSGGRISGGGISRSGRAAMVAFFVLGTAILVNPAWWIERFFSSKATSTLYAAFAYDDDFLRLRGPILLGLIVLNLVLQVILLVQGRWQPITRKAEIVLDVTFCAALFWTLAAGPVFQSKPADQAMRGAMALTALFTVIELVKRFRRGYAS